MTVRQIIKESIVVKLTTRRIFHVYHSTYVWKCICEYMCLCVRITYVCTYVYMYTYLEHLWHKQVHICTCVNVIIFSTTHTYKPTFNDKHVSFKLMISERITWCIIAKIHAKSLYDALALLNFFWLMPLAALRGCSLRFGVLLCFIDPRVRKIKNEASSCPGIFSRTLRFGRAASGGALAPEPAARHRGRTRVFTGF